MTGATGGASVDRARSHHGVAFDAWAFVLAGLGDGLPEDELLAHLGITEDHWHLANTAFQEDILDDVEAGGTLTEAFDEAMRAARTTWSRPIPPLDTDLRAWLDFFRVWTAADSPTALLEEHGLRATDIHRLNQHWSDKLAKDEALRGEALAILASPAGLAPAFKAESPRLPRAVAADAADATKPARVCAVEPLPFSECVAELAHPRLSVRLPLPERVAPAECGGLTRAAPPVDSPGLVLPFSPSPPAIPVAEETDASAKGADAPRAEPGEVALSIERYAALCVDLTESPDAHEVVLRRYGISAAEKLALDVHWTQQMAADPTTWLAWDRASAQHRAAGSRDGDAGPE